MVAIKRVAAPNGSRRIDQRVDRPFGNSGSVQPNGLRPRRPRDLSNGPFVCHLPVDRIVIRRPARLNENGGFASEPIVAFPHHDSEQESAGWRQEGDVCDLQYLFVVHTKR